MLGHLLHNVLDLIFPPRCSGCGRVDTRWCARCAQNLAAVPLAMDAVRLLGLDALVATGEHSGQLQRAVQALKYEGVLQVAEPLAQRMIRVIDAQNWRFDRVLAVPLHRRRLAQRGYNQAKALAHIIAQHYQLPLADDLLTRQRDTRTQVGLNRPQRIANMEGAFLVTPTKLQGQRILLVDDVRTTGATISACAQALRSAGASRVYGITVTRAALHQHQDR